MPWLSFDEQVEKLTGIVNPRVALMHVAQPAAPIMYEGWLHPISCALLPTD